MATLPADRTKLALAQGNQVPSAVIASAKNINSITEAYDTIDTLYNYVLSLVTSGTLSPLPPDFLGKQIAINPNFDVWQRGTSFTNPNNGQYVADRWWAYRASNANTTYQRVAISNLIGARYCIRVSRESGTDEFVLGTSFETDVVKKFLGKTITASIYLRKGSLLTSNVSLTLRTITAEQIIGTPVDVETISIPASSLNQVSFTRFSVTLTIPDNSAALGMEVSINALQAGGGNVYYDVAQLQICEGSTELPFHPRSFAEELTLCQRYYWKTFPMAVTPAQASLNYSGALSYVVRVSSGGYIDGVRAQIPRMRVLPTLTFYNPISANSKWYNRNIAADSGASGTPFGDSGENGITVNNTQIGSDVVGNTIYVHATADAEIG